MSKTEEPIALPSATPALSFTFDAKQLRVVMRDDEPWFIAADVCSVLEIQNVTQAVSRLDEDERAMFNIGEAYVVNIVSEPGFYTLAMRSRKPEARRFRRWVTHEVLPSIRRTGSYSAKRQAPLERQIGRCQTLIRDIERSKSKFCRDGLLALAGLAFADVGLPMPDLKGLHPLQLPLVPEGGAA
jgi:prophage antirepressor-like protein